MNTPFLLFLSAERFQINPLFLLCRKYPYKGPSQGHRQNAGHDKHRHLTLPGFCPQGTDDDIGCGQHNGDSYFHGENPGRRLCFFSFGSGIWVHHSGYNQDTQYQKDKYKNFADAGHLSFLKFVVVNYFLPVINGF